MQSLQSRARSLPSRVRDSFTLNPKPLLLGRFGSQRWTPSSGMPQSSLFRVTVAEALGIFGSFQELGFHSVPPTCSNPYLRTDHEFLEAPICVSAKVQRHQAWHCQATRRLPGQDPFVASQLTVATRAPLFGTSSDAEGRETYA